MATKEPGRDATLPPSGVPGGAGAFLSEISRFQFSQADLPGAVRCTIGVVVCLVVGISTGAVADGVSAAIGALCAGFASFQAAYRRRVAITVLVGFGMAAATISGALAWRATWSAVVVVAAWALAAGMMTALSPAALVVGLQWGVAVIIVAAIPMTTGQALVRGGMILAGAVVQTVLVVFAWPVRTYRPERVAVAALYNDLAGYARAAARGSDIGLPSTCVDAAREAIINPHPLGRTSDLMAFQALVDEGERTRIQLVALARLRGRTAREGGATGALDRFLEAVATSLSCVATALLSNPQGRAVVAASAVDPPTLEDVPPWLAHEIEAMAASLAGKLRSIGRLVAATSGGAHDADLGDGGRPRYRRRDPGEMLETLRANLSWQSTTLRHSIRLAVTLAVAVLIDRLTGLAHGYWIALTALIVLRQDYATTTVRGLSRIAGTIVGAILATLLVALIRPDTVGLAVLFGATAFIAFVIVRVNYALFSISVTAYVVFLLAFAREPVLAVVSARLLGTLIGGGLALGAYLAWPTWESRLVGPQLAELLEAQARYGEVVLACVADPASSRRGELDSRRAAARRARSNAELSVSRMSAEPERSRRDAPLSLGMARGIVAASRRCAASLLTLHAALSDEEARAVPAVADLAGPLIEAMRRNAQALRARVPAPPAPAPVLAAVGISPRGRDEDANDQDELRRLHGSLVAALSGREDEPFANLVLAETDELVDGVNSVSELLIQEA